MSSLVPGEVEVRAGVLFGADFGTEVVVFERVEVLEFVRMGICCGRGRWWMSYACEMVNRCRLEDKLG